MRLHRIASTLIALCFVGACCAESDVVTPAYFDKTIAPVLKESCGKCHSTEKQKGDIDLERFTSLAEVRKHAKVWQAVAEQLALGEMPPASKPQPTPAQREQLVGWVQAVLDAEARLHAGDPGPVVLRRLSNAEYTYTIRDLTGVALDPAREFPVDGAAGEGFMNTGAALVMSPGLLTKYFDAGKEIASHAVLLPDGIRFSAATSRRDWTEEALAGIRNLYGSLTEAGGGDKVNLQGVVFETNGGGRLPLEKYFAATLAVRERAKDGVKVAIVAVAQERGLSAKYLALLWEAMNATEPSPILDGIRARWREAKPGDLGALVASVAQWQKALWKFNSVGGVAAAKRKWMEPQNPFTAKQEVKLKLAVAPDAKEVSLWLVASDAGDGNEHDVAVWQQPRLVAPGRPDLPLRDLRAVAHEFTERRERIATSVVPALAAAAEVAAAQGAIDVEAVARAHGVEADLLKAWLDYLGFGVGASGELVIADHFTKTFSGASGFDFIKGWNTAELPNLTANSSDKLVRIPGNMKPHSIAVHPSPKLQAAVGWRSPVIGTFRVAATVTHAHPECGNGVTWVLELRRGATRRRLAAGTAQGSKEVVVPPVEKLAVRQGDLISLLIGPRDGNHSCDLTTVDLVLTSLGENGREWNLAREVSPDVLAGNPHADAFGNAGVWHFYSEPDNNGDSGKAIIPAGSLVSKWLAATSPDEKQKLAEEVQKLLAAAPPTAKDAPDTLLYQQLTAPSGPLYGGMLTRHREPPAAGAPAPVSDFGVDPALFGRRPGAATGKAIDAASLCVRAPSLIEVRIPAVLAAGAEFVTTGALDPETGAEGSVQLQVLTAKPGGDAGLPDEGKVAADGALAADSRRLIAAAPILAQDGSAVGKRFIAAGDEFRRIFPAALCYVKIVPTDEVITLTLFYREDDQLARLMLDEAQQAQLDRLWSELHFVSRDALTRVDAFEQIWQFTTQDGDPKLLEPLRQPIKDDAAAFAKLQVDSEPRQLQAVLDVAANAYRRPLNDGEAKELRALYRKLRDQELGHEEAIRLTIARIFVAPAFLYRLEKSAPGAQQGALTDWELASRLSYFLWSSQPDTQLRELAAAGKLHDPDALAAQARRLMGDERVRRLAVEFACQWLHIRDFDQLDEKSEKSFPTFVAMRGPLYEEAIRFFTDLFQRDASVLDLFDADYTFLNEDLAKHYGIPGVTGAQWRRVDGVRKYSRGGILALGATLAKQSGASRTSPILRGNWLTETLLGEKLPRPPKDVPRLPEDEATESLSVRQLVEKHTSDAKCAGCHVRIDPYGFALEGFDAIGRARDKDLAGRPIDTHAKLKDGTPFEGLAGLRAYLLGQRQDTLLHQFCRKLLGYALGRSVRLSDEPLITEMIAGLRAHGYHFSTAVEAIVRSRQFREIRGAEAPADD